MTEGDNKQLKFIEILLIVGAIISGLSENPLYKVILACFLISSLIYYLAVSNPRNSEFWANKKLFAWLISGFFSVLITYPIVSGPPVWGPNIDKPLGLIFTLFLLILIFKNLQEETEEREKPED